ncbi:MAG: hypothetical protein ACRBG0_01445 [Lewinella sp.]|uniref:hypothetical protein n=1 Tax=Lewinella sp. TaxID=2004506 RepID=UPI003D6A8CEB
MNKIIFVDDDRLYYEAVRDLVQSKLPEDYRIEKYIKHPAPKGNFADGPLMQYLRSEIESSTDTYIIMLDLKYGSREAESKVGIDMAEHLIDEFGTDGQVKILCMTNYANRLYYDQLYQFGVRVFIFKPNLEHTIMAALDAALNNEVFTPGYVPGKNAIDSDTNISLVREEVARMIAKGFANKTLRREGYTSVDVQKLQFKRATSLSSQAHISDHRMPNDDEWNDVYFLLYFLGERDKEVIDYLEKVCNIEISVPN